MVDVSIWNWPLIKVLLNHNAMANFNQFHFKCTNGRAAFLRQIAMIINKSFAKSSSLEKEIDARNSGYLNKFWTENWPKISNSRKEKKSWKSFLRSSKAVQISLQFDDFFLKTKLRFDFHWNLLGHPIDQFQWKFRNVRIAEKDDSHRFSIIFPFLSGEKESLIEVIYSVETFSPTPTKKLSHTPSCSPKGAKLSIFSKNQRQSPWSNFYCTITER